MDWLITGALVVGAVFGYAGRSVRHPVNPRLSKKEKVEQQKQQATLPKCLCGHWFNVHDPKQGKCQSSSTVVEDTEIWGGAHTNRTNKKTQESCNCMGYLGPDPLVSGLWQSDSLKGATS